MEQYINAYGYKISIDPDFMNEHYGINEQLRKMLELVIIELQNTNDKKIILKIKKLIEQYPHLPQLRNYLTLAYVKYGYNNKADDNNEQTLILFPNYLFAKLNVASNFILENKFDKAIEILGKDLELKNLYPKRQVFHYAEFLNYYKIAILYYSKTNNLEKAEKALIMLKEIAPDDPITEEAEELLLSLRLANYSKLLNLRKEREISPKILKKIPSNTKKEKPEFNHIEIELLYKYDTEIGRAHV